MSIVNQMLKDLDARRGPSTGPELTALRGLGLVTANPAAAFRLRIFLASSMAALLAVYVGYQALDWRPRSALPPAPQAAMPDPRALVAETNAQLHAPAPIPDDRSVQADPSSAHSDAATQTTGAAIAPEQRIATELASTEAPDVADTGLVRQTPLPDATEQVAVALPTPAPPAAAKPIKHLSAEQKSDRLFADAQRALAVQDYAEGEILLRQALFEYPRHHGARAQLATLLAARRDHEAGERLLIQGLQASPRSIELARTYAQLLVDRGALDQALDTLNSVLAAGHADADSYALRGAVLQRLQRHTEAAGDYRFALKQQDRNATWWAGLAIAEEHDHRLAQALAAYRQAARLPMEDSLRNYVNQRIKLIQNTDGL